MLKVKKLIKGKYPFAVKIFCNVRLFFLKMNTSILKAVRTLEKAAKRFRCRKTIRLILKKQNKISLELGAGNKKGAQGWITIDNEHDSDIFWDLRKGIPFPDESVTKIYSSHFFEHLSFNEGQKMLDECRRVLIPGGSFSICVPNARPYCELYLRPDAQLEAKLSGYYKPGFNNTTRIDYMNYTAYMDGQHKYMFDEENLLYILKAKGFQNVRQRKFDACLDQREREFDSIYAEAEK